MAGGRVGWWGRALAGLAALNAVLAVVWLGGVSDWFAVTAVGVVLAVVTAVPLAVPGRGPFAVACLASAVLLIVLAVPLVFFGGHLFLPGAVVLLVAWFTRRRAVSGRVGGPVVAALALAIAVPWSVAVHHSVLGAPNVYLVHFAPGAPRPAADVLDGDGDGIGFGATGVSQGDGGLYITFRAGLSADERRGLERRLRELMPYAERIERCESRRACRAP